MARTRKSRRPGNSRSTNNAATTVRPETNRGSAGDLREQLSRGPADLREQLSRPNSADRSVDRVGQREVPPVETPVVAPNLQAAPAPVLANILTQVIEAWGRTGVLPVPVGQNVPNQSAPLEPDRHTTLQTNDHSMRSEGHAPSQTRAARPVRSRLGPAAPVQSVMDRLGSRAGHRSHIRPGGRIEQQFAQEPRQEDVLRPAASKHRREVVAVDLESSGETPARRARVQPDMADLAKEISDLRQKMEGKQKLTVQTLLNSSPFSEEILSYKAPGDFKLPEHPTYDGSGDPRDHLISFQAKMQVIGAEDPMFCRAFFPTLSGPAQRWFLSLSPKSVTSFEVLADQFLTHFAGNIKPKKHFSDLRWVHQNAGESLRNYIARWQKEVRAVEGLDDKTALTLFVESLHADGQYSKLRDENPRTYAQAIQRANQLADTEEAIKQKRRQEGSLATRRPRPDDSRGNRPETTTGTRTDTRRPQDRLGAPIYKPPMSPVHEVRNLLPPPPPIRPGDNPQLIDPNATPYCRYHRTSTHTTQECDALKAEIEMLIQRGRQIPPNQGRRPGLPWHSNTAPRPADKGKQPDQGEDNERNWKHKPIINMIVGSPEGGDTAGARKAWARQLYMGRSPPKIPI